MFVKWNKVDPTAMRNSSPYMPHFKDFAPADNLKRGNNKNANIGTICELNQTVLNKTQKYLPSRPSTDNFGMWCDNLSNENCTFNNTPTLRIMFSSAVSSAGITLMFDELDFCTDLSVEWYKETTLDSIIETKRFTPNEPLYFCDNPVKKYKMIYIKFNKTSFPKRFIKLNNILYGEVINWSSKDLISCNLLEEISLTSEQISVNTLDLKVFSVKNLFNMVVPNQTVEVDNYGTFYLQTFKSDGLKQISLKAIDLYGRFENIPYNGGYFSNVTIKSILQDFLQVNKLDNCFEMPPQIEHYRVTGYIPKTNGRELLHKLCFASFAVIDCSRSDKIKICERKKLKADFTIEDKLLLLGSFNSEHKPFYDRVVLRGDMYTPLDERVHIETVKATLGTDTYYYEGFYTEVQVEGMGIIINEIGSGYVIVTTSTSDTTFSISGIKYKHIETVRLPVGVHTRHYDVPYKNIQAGGVKVIKSGTNYITIEVTTADIGIIISGIEYAVSKLEFTAGEGDNVKTFDNINFLSNHNGQTLADNLLDFYTNINYSATFETLHIPTVVSDVVKVGEVIGYVNSLEIDLLKGKLTKGGVIGANI